jgi:phosphatidylinositol 4-kinase
MLLIQFAAHPVFSYSAALGWFAYAHEYYESPNKSFAQREAQSVSIFVHNLQNERATSSTDSGPKSQGREGELNTV